ncbi:MAG: peptide chain release factor N(5)-glutamine methyltransferase [Clostridiales bacterium]|jgi:release factor glutamine methyltransferase|nr:peptide chain release factor N(5)-glutamine methyltransferase [Clostridiales bacterium]
MNTYNELLQTAREFLNKNGVADADLDAWYLLAHVFGIDRADFFIYRNDVVSQEKALHYRMLIKKRASHIPLQYIIGRQEFMGLEFEVNENVLIPRQDTELLVEEVLKICQGKSVLDMCTGSGCIIVSLAKLGSIKTAVGSDISIKAIELAEKNSKRHNVKVNFIQSDLFDSIVGSYDIIVSNPPYIKSADLKTLMPEVKDHEPRQALDAGPDGLIFYKRIIDDIKRFLNPGGYVFFEIGYDQGEAVSNMLDLSGFVDITIKKDFSDLDRIVHARKSFL